MDDEKEELIERIQDLTGREPDGVRYILKLLAHPGLIEHTRRYFGNLDDGTRCLKYDVPWSCAKEAEARFETVTDGWFGPGTELGFKGFGDNYTQFWCENCRKGKTEDEI